MSSSRMFGALRFKLNQLNPVYGGAVRHETTQQVKHTNLKVVDNIAVVTFDSPNSKVNTLNSHVMEEFGQFLNELENNPRLQAAVIISAKPGCFIAGADISVLSKCKDSSEATSISRVGQTLLGAIENSKKPVVAAIQGSCLGGGLETALACHYRIAVKDKKTNLGLPEVMLGLLPGAGGTQRLPQLTSIPNTLDIVLTGKMIKADKAKKLGIVDMLVDPLGPGLNTPEVQTQKYLEETAINVAKQLASGKLKVERKRKA